MAIGNKGQALEEFQNQLVDIDSGSKTKQTLGAILADFRHASKIFGSNAFANAPKNKFLFHVYFDINPAAYVPIKPEESSLIGILVRDVKLPSYTFTTHQLNQYNRKRIVQTKIKYDPVNFTFHDDMSNIIAKMWAAYYTYYYADGSQPAVLFSGNSNNATSAVLAPPSGGQTQVSTLTNYQLRTQYVPSTALPNPNNWGYIGDTNTPSATDYAKAPFFNNITIFGLMRHDFLAYTLINPVITQFSHDSYNYDEGNGVMKNTMAIDYETVVYNEGQLDGLKPSNIVTGFGQNDTYDLVPSPITIPKTEGYVVTDQGVVPGTSGGMVESLRRPSVENPNPNFGPTTTSYSLPDVPFLDSADEINAQLQNAEENTDNGTRNMPFAIPSPSTSPGPAGLASALTIGPDGYPVFTQPVNIFGGLNGNINSILYNSGQAGAPQTAGVQVTGVNHSNFKSEPAGTYAGSSGGSGTADW